MTCYVPPPGPGETGARVCETYPEIRARQIAHWNNYIKVTAMCPWPTVLLDRDPGPADDYGAGFRTGQFWHNTDTGATYVAETVYPGGGAVWNQISGSGAGVWVRITLTIPATTTQVVDTVALSGFISIKYIGTFYNESQNASKALELTVVREGSSLKDSVYSKVSQLDVAVDAVVSGSNLNLSVTNNESFPVQVDLIKAVFG